MTQMSGISAEQLEELLSGRRTSRDEPWESHWYAAALRMVSAVATGATEEDEIAQAESALRAMEEDGLLRPLELDCPARMVSSVRRRWIVPSAAIAAALLIGVSMGIYLRVAGRDGVVSPQLSALSPKGSGDSMQVAVGRGASSFQLGADMRVLTGDALGFFYSADQGGYLRLYNVDSEGIVTLLFPLSADTGAIAAGNQVSLPDGAVVTDGSGCEWLVAVFSDQSMSGEDAQIRQSLETEMKRSENCAARFSIDGARAVRVMNLTREENQ